MTWFHVCGWEQWRGKARGLQRSDLGEVGSLTPTLSSSLPFSHGRPPIFSSFTHSRHIIRLGWQSELQMVINSDALSLSPPPPPHTHAHTQTHTLVLVSLSIFNYVHWVITLLCNGTAIGSRSHLYGGCERACVCVYLQTTMRTKVRLNSN